MVTDLYRFAGRESEAEMTLRDKLKQYPTIVMAYRIIITLNPYYWIETYQRNNIRYICLENKISLIQNMKSNVAYFFPYLNRGDFHRTQLNILKNGFHKHLHRKYSTEDCHVNSGDTVIDCGGFVGGFSVAAVKMNASRVIYVEPTPITRHCAQLNFDIHDCENIPIYPYALGEENGTATLNLSRSGADNSILEPDAGSTNEQITVDVITLDDIAVRENLNPNNTFVKIEAEGYEVEIVKGMKEFRPHSLVVDVSPERDGLSPRDEILGLLSDKGYVNFFHTQNCLFAKK